MFKRVMGRKYVEAHKLLKRQELNRLVAKAGLMGKDEDL